jgi:hypothetical protein
VKCVSVLLTNGQRLDIGRGLADGARAPVRPSDGLQARAASCETAACEWWLVESSACFRRLPGLPWCASQRRESTEEQRADDRRGATQEGSRCGLLLEGRSYDDIAHRVGYAYRGSAHRAIRQALEHREVAAVDHRENKKSEGSTHCRPCSGHWLKRAMSIRCIGRSDHRATRSPMRPRSSGRRHFRYDKLDGYRSNARPAAARYIYMVARLRGCEVARLRGCEVARLRGCEVARLRGCEVARAIAMTHSGQASITVTLWTRQSGRRRRSSGILSTVP